jgi:hypothetical protein
MNISKRNFPKIIRDNDDVYFMHLQGVIDSVDELCNMEITKTPHSYHFRIAPSVPIYLIPLLNEILKLNTIYGIHLDLSKSMKASSTIAFDIEIIE